MFYCNECAVKYGYTKSLGKSIGKCECCDSVAECNDVASSKLPIPTRIDGTVISRDINGNLTTKSSKS